MNNRYKEWIDSASYDDLLYRWRFAPSSDPIFEGPIGEYYRKVMEARRVDLSPTEQVAASKRVGWEKKV